MGADVRRSAAPVAENGPVMIAVAMARSYVRPVMRLLIP
jgi:hypothetical protein